MSAIILNGEIVHYEVLGRGRPVIFLHGWVGSWRYWIPAMQSASTTHRAYALDLWGFGDTAKSSSNYLIEKQSDLLDQFLKEMGIGKVALVGHGLGAVVALKYTLKESFSVDRVMMISFPVNENDFDARLAIDPPSELADWLLGQSTDNDAARAEAPKADKQAIEASLKDLKGLETLEYFKQLKTAFLLVHGQNDPAIRTPNLDSNGQLSGQAHHIIFEESGHFPMLDQSNKFNRLLADFMALESGESPRHLQLKEEWKRRVR